VNEFTTVFGSYTQVMAKQDFFSTEIIFRKHIETTSSIRGTGGAGQQAILWEKDGIPLYSWIQCTPR